MLADPRVRKMSFTGSTEVGRMLLAQAAEHVVNTSMELGGNAPFVVFADADLDAALDGAMIAKMRNGGEACTAANRFYVEAPVADEFARRLAERDGRAAGRPRHRRRTTQVGPLVNEDTVAKVDELVRDAVADGATAAHRRHPAGRAGFYYPPTVLTGVRPDAAILREEIFGPVAPIVTFTTEARGGPARQRHRVRPGRVRLHRRPGPRAAGQRGASRPAWSASTAAWSATRPRRSAG